MTEPRAAAVRPLQSSAARRRARARWLRVAFGSAVLLIGAGTVLSLLAGGPASRPTAAGDRGPTASPLASAGEAPSIEAERVSCLTFEVACHRLTLPLDPDEPGAGTIRVVFGRHEAEDERRGTLVIATGGPGSSGLEAAPYYLEVLPQAVRDRFDIVFFDQRGVGRSSALACRDAEPARPRNDDPLDAAPALETATRSWVVSCLAESGVGADALAAYHTTRVADDLEAYRTFLGADELHLYGESYGTAVVQQYAASYPERVAGLVLDGPIDTSIDAIEFADAQLTAFWEVTLETFQACSEDPACTDDLGQEPHGAWDRLVAELEVAPRVVDYPVSLTATERRELSLDAVTDQALSMMYTEYERMLFLRAVAAAVDGDAVPLLQFSYLYQGLDPETLDPVTRRSDGTALFLAVHCGNYADLPDRAAGLDELRQLGATLAATGNPYASLVWDDLPCLHGFTELGREVTRPGAPHGDFSTLVLTATADPATPVGWAEGIARQASDGYLIRTNGGAHVTFGVGWGCPDDLVVDFLLYGEVPDRTVTECDGYVMEPYVPLPHDSIGAYADVAEALVAIEQNLFSLPTYFLWDGYPAGGACNHGGWLSLSWDGEDDVIRLNECELIPGWPLEGTMRYAADGTTTMEVTVPNGDLTYTSSPLWEVEVRGTLDGQPVEIERAIQP